MIVRQWWSWVFALLLAASALRALAQEPHGEAVLSSVFGATGELSAKPRVIAPYVWLVDITGSVGLGGMSVPIDVKATDLVSDVNGGFMGHFEWTFGRQFVYADSIYISMNSKHFEPFFEQSVEASVIYAELGYGWRILKTVSFPTPGTLQISPYVGARHIWLDVDVNGPQIAQSARERYLDPVLGTTLEGPIWRDLGWAAQFEFAGLSIGRDNFRSGTALLRYNVNDSVSLLAGYRLGRYQSDAKGNALKLDLKPKGPLVGVTFAF